MARFQLDANLSAQENLWHAARWASIVVLKRNRFYGVTAQDKSELIEEVTLAAVNHFLTFKIGQKRYARFAKDGRPLTFFDNCLSSAWSCAPNVAQPILKRIQLKVNTSNIDDLAFRLSEADKFPRYMALDEYGNTHSKPVHELKRPADRAQRYRRMYEDYVAEVEYMGLSETLPFDKWLCRCGFNKDAEACWYLLKPEDRIELTKMQAALARRARDEELLEAGNDDRALLRRTKRSIYMREYARRQREQQYEQVNQEISRLYGPPSTGYRWHRTAKGKIIMKRLK